MNEYERLIKRAQGRHGDKFDASDLVPAFVRYFNSGERIEVTDGDYVRRGRVGVTTGWRPAFLLVHRTSDHGSSDVLSDRDRVIKVIARGLT